MANGEIFDVALLVIIVEVVSIGSAVVAFEEVAGLEEIVGFSSHLDSLENN